MAAVTDFLRRTPVARSLPTDAVWRPAGDAAILARVAANEAVGALAIIDLSPLPRIGFKGRDTIPVMKARGLVLEAEPNRAFRQPDGGLCLVLGQSEIVLLGSLDGNNARLQVLEAGWRIEDEERAYLVPRRDSHAWFAVVGIAAGDMFAKLCGVDLRPQKFADLAIAQTSVARLNAVVTRADLGGRPVFHLLADSASAAYLLDCLCYAAEEFGGTLTGLAALRP